MLVCLFHYEACFALFQAAEFLTCLSNAGFDCFPYGILTALAAVPVVPSCAELHVIMPESFIPNVHVT